MVDPFRQGWLEARRELLSRLNGEGRAFDDDWWRKTGRGKSSEHSSMHLRFDDADARNNATRQVDMRERFARLANGAQPVVTKVIGFGGGGATSRAISYISRGGQVRLENEVGQDLFGRNVASQTTKDWAPLFSGGEKSRDLCLFQAEIWGDRSGSPSVEASITALHHAFNGRLFAAAINRSGEFIQVRGIVVLNLPAAGRLTTDERARYVVEERIQISFGKGVSKVEFLFGRNGHGVRFAGTELRRLVEQNPGRVLNQDARPIDSLAVANHLVQRDWRSKMASREPRDHMHLLVAAPGETVLSSFEAALRQFLKQEFGGHRYLFATHDPIHDPKAQTDGGKRPHLHAHALIASRSDYGERLKVWVSDLNRWRHAFAACARNHGISLEVTHRHEILAARAYRHHDVRATSFSGRTAHIGTSASAQRRYDEKRSERPHVDGSVWANKQSQLARKIWLEILDESTTARGQAFAEHMLARFNDLGRGASHNQFRDVAPSSVQAVLSSIAQRRRDESAIGFEPAEGEGRRMVLENDEGRRVRNVGPNSPPAQKDREVREMATMQSRMREALSSAMGKMMAVVQTSRQERQHDDFANKHAIKRFRDGSPSSALDQRGQNPDLGADYRHSIHINLAERGLRPELENTHEGVDSAVTDQVQQRIDRVQDEPRTQGGNNVKMARERNREDDRVYDR